MILQENTKQKITCSKDVAGILTKLLSIESEIDQDKEHFWVIGLNVRQVVKFIDLVSLGLTETVNADPRQTFRLAVMKNVIGIIIAHNHPSGEPSPSQDDCALTKRIKESGKILGIELLDSLIITNEENNFYSFMDNGML